MNVAGLSSITTQPIFPSPTPPPARADQAGGKANFGEMIKQAVEAVDKDQEHSAASIHQLLTGKQQDALPVVAAVAKADISFKLLIGIRNKMIEAYKQTVNMQV